MADANDGRVTLWRTMSGYWRLATPDDGKRSSGTAYIARPRAADDAREDEYRHGRALVSTFMDKVNDAEARAEKAEEALRFYADRANWRCPTEHSFGAAIEDSGAKAREALGEAKS